MTMIVLNTKGGAGKSTTALQVAAAYFLQRGEDVDLFEFDDENKDSLSFSDSAIRTEQVKIGDGKNISDILRKTLLSDNLKNVVIDVGGNKTTTIFIEGLKKTSLHYKIDLIFIPLSGGSQNYINAVKTYELVKAFNKKIIFVFTRVNDPTTLFWEYDKFRIEFPNHEYIVLTQSPVIELSRKNKKSIYEVSIDKDMVALLQQQIIEEFSKENNNDKIAFLSKSMEIQLEAGDYHENVLVPAWQKIDEVMGERDE